MKILTFRILQKYSEILNPGNPRKICYLFKISSFLIKYIILELYRILINPKK